jgi:single-strand DNA-binding protein
MAGVNKVILVGNLGKDPEVRHLENGSVVANVTLATTESYKDKNGTKIDSTEWHDLELWDGLAKIAEQFLRKGKSIYVEGKIKSDTWQDEQGNNRKKIRIRVQNLTMLGGPADSAGGAAPAASMEQRQPLAKPAAVESNISASEETDDLPF